MATERSNNLRAFKCFVDEKLSNAEADLTLDDALTYWDYENQTEEEREATLQAVREGLADADAGRVRPFEDFDRDFRQKYGLPPRT
jgi:predicted transcriptional regulator